MLCFLMETALIVSDEYIRLVGVAGVKKTMEGEAHVSARLG